ncbi:MAG: hypothetical protein DPW23_03985 [Gammaproteobacteria bacterium]|nr:hypothetical protein [Gammaproteobacteria bacterium]
MTHSNVERMNRVAWDKDTTKAVIVPNPGRRGPARRRGRHCQLLALLLAMAAPSAMASSDAGDSARLPMTDRGPLNGVIGVPDGWTSAAMPAADISWSVVNNAVGQQSSHESLLFDGETQALVLRAGRRFGRRLSLGLEVPWLSHGGGFLDRFIDSWHDGLGLDPGIRPELPTGDLHYSYLRDGVQLLNLQHQASGLGDLTTSAAWALAGVDASSKLPLVELTTDIQWGTGDADDLTGSGSTDIAAGLAVRAPAGGRLGWSLRAGLLWPGAVDAALPAVAGQVYYYEGSLSWRLVPTLDLVVQVLGHSGTWQSDLKLLGGHSLQLGAGGHWRFGKHFGLRFAVFEDLRVDSAPDFGLELALAYRP